MEERNFYGQPIVDPALYDETHRVALVPPTAGLPPVCSCGWTRRRMPDGSWYELWEHLREFAE